MPQQSCHKYVNVNDDSTSNGSVFIATQKARGSTGRVPVSFVFAASPMVVGRHSPPLPRTRLAKLRHHVKLAVYQECVRQRETIQDAANRCGIIDRTTFLWRLRFLAEASELVALCGAVELDETFFRESANGDRSLRTRRPPRKRGGLGVLSFVV